MSGSARTLVIPDAIPAIAGCADRIALALAASVAELGGAPAALHHAAVGEAGALPAEVASLVQALHSAVTALLELVGRVSAADARYSCAEQDVTAQARAQAQVMVRLDASIPWPRPPGSWHELSQTARSAADVAGVLGVEALVGLLPQPLVRAVALVGDRVPDGPGWARATGASIRGPGPLSAADLLAAVSRAQRGPGQIAITHLTGTERWIVALPGIHSMLEASDPQDLPGALLAFSSGHGAYARSVVDALTAAGVPVGAQLLLVGHSQGGIVAADLAADPQVASRWQITDVLTAGSPIGQVRVPPQTRLLAMDNANDIVPSLDLTDDAPRPDRATIRFRDERGSVGRNHDLAEVYTPFARSPDFTNRPDARRWAEHAAPYLSGGPATTQLFDVLDRPPVAPPASGHQSAG